MNHKFLYPNREARYQSTYSHHFLQLAYEKDGKAKLHEIQDSHGGNKFKTEFFCAARPCIQEPT